jgi:hypothetical protein
MSDAPKKMKKTRMDLDSIESRSTDGSDDGEDLKDFLVEEEDSSPPSTTENDDELARTEAEKFVGEVPSTVVGRYSLRDRSKIRKVEVYFDAENAAIVQKNQDKAEMLQLLKKWKLSKEYEGIELKKSLTYEQVLEEYLKAKAFLNLPDSEDEEEEEEEEEDEDEDEEEEEDDEDEDEEEEEDEDEDDDEEDDEDEDDEDDEEEDEDSSDASEKE